ncbi:MAG: trypsin-like serine protease [Anaerolineae bacterium]|nr:trypsin-like serine protease [Anaerolineae bacterium]
MDASPDMPSLSQSGFWKKRLQQLRAAQKNLALFGTGILAAVLGFWLYNTLFPTPKPPTLKEVNEAVAKAMASATPAPPYSAQVYQAIQPSLVLIQSKGKDADGKEESGLGSGVVISDQGEILTALHVVEDAAEIRITFADGTRSGAQVVSVQPENDIAVLQAEQLPTLLIPAVLGNPNARRVGDEAFAVGNPFGLYGSMSAGIISGFNRSFQAEGSSRKIEGLIQIDTAVNPGNSGGPLLNRNGQVIGIVIGILNPMDEEFFVGIGFAVPITVAGRAAGLPPY